MRRGLFLVLVGLVAYAVFAASSLPARLAYDWVGDRLGVLSLYGVYGTLCQGGARSVSLQHKELGSVAWVCQPQALARGRFEYTLDLQRQAHRGTAYVAANWNGTLAVRGRGVPMSMLIPLLGRVSLPLGGSVSADLDQIRIRDGQLTAGQGTIDWERAVLTFETPVELGTISVSLDSDAEGVQGRLSDAGGPLGVDGTLQLRSGGVYQLSLALRVRDENNEDLLALVQTLGEPDRSGRVSIRLSGRLDI